MTSTSELPHRFYNRFPNTGDALSSYLVKLLCDSEPVFTDHASPHLLGIGSILFMASPASIVWGTGLLNEATAVPEIQGGQIRAVRGLLTADALTKAGVKLGNVPIGDPGIFASQLLRHANQRSSGKPIVIFPHHSSVDHPFYHMARLRNDVEVLDPSRTDLYNVNAICNCRVVISESLHGLIFAESLGKPYTWISNHAADEHSTFKYRDWFSSTQFQGRRPLSFKNTIEELLSDACLCGSTIDLLGLRQSFPSFLRTERTGKRLLSFEKCRDQEPLIMMVNGLMSSHLVEIQNLGSSPIGDALIANVANEAFSIRAERTFYCILSGERSVVISSKQIQEMIALLTWRLDIDFLFIDGTIPDRVDSFAFQSLSYSTNAVETPIGIVMRPDIDNFRGKHAVVYLSC